MPSAPSVLWDTMVAPLTRQTFRGVVFYQGESNAVRGKNAETAKYYGCAINALIADWRQKFAGGGDLAFHQTLLAPINTVWGFAGIRIGQQAALGQVRNNVSFLPLDVTSFLGSFSACFVDRSTRASPRPWTPETHSDLGRERFTRATSRRWGRGCRSSHGRSRTAKPRSRSKGHGWPLWRLLGNRQAPVSVRL